MVMTPQMLALIKGAKNKFSKSTGKTLRLKEGKTTIRLIAIQVQGAPAGQFWQELGVHWIKPSPDSKPLAVVGCHHITFDTPCPVCEGVERAKAGAVSDEDLKVFKDWNGKKSVLVLALLRSGSDASEENPVIVELTPTTFGFILALMDEYSADYGDITDPSTGMDLTIERSGKGFDTEYKVMPKLKAKPVPRAALEKAAEMDLRAYAEKEFFRGEETKALTHIANLTGVSVTGIAAPRSTALLTSSVARVDDAVMPSTVTKITPVESAGLDAIADEIIEETPPFEVDPPAEEEDEEAALLAQMAALKAKKAAKAKADAAAAKAVAVKPAAPKPAAKPVAPPVEVALDADEVDSLLAELDNI